MSPIIRPIGTSYTVPAYLDSSGVLDVSLSGMLAEERRRWSSLTPKEREAELREAEQWRRERAERLRADVAQKLAESDSVTIPSVVLDALRSAVAAGVPEGYEIEDGPGSGYSEDYEIIRQWEATR